MIQAANLRHTVWSSSYLDLSFLINISDATQCVKNNPCKLMHSIILRKSYFAIKIKNINIQYFIDSDGINLCSGKSNAKCIDGSKSIIINIPELPQPYWEGDQKKIDIRACFPEGIDLEDFNVSYSIKLNIHNPDDELNKNFQTEIISNMHVLIG